MHVDLKYSHSVWHSERTNSQNGAVVKRSDCFLQRNTLIWSRKLYVTVRKSSIVLEFDGFPHNKALWLIWKHWGVRGRWLPWRFTHQRLEMNKSQTRLSHSSVQNQRNVIFCIIFIFLIYFFFALCINCLCFFCALHYFSSQIMILFPKFCHFCNANYTSWWNL